MFNLFSKISMKLFYYLILAVLFQSVSVHAAIEMMSDSELADVDAQVSEISIVNHNQENDTVRIFLDIHQEVYGTIDSVRVGYYYKDSTQLRITPMSIGLSGFDGYYHGVDNINNGANFNFMKITSDFNTMAPANGSTLEPWGNGGYDEDDPEGTTTANCNNFDWDLWIDNLQNGDSPDEPQVINGMIIRFEFDSSVYSENPHLERIIVGTNDQQGNMYMYNHRFTACMNGLLETSSTNRSAGAVDPYKYTAGAVLCQRDTIVESFGVTTQDIEDRDTGFWLVIDVEEDHLGFKIIIGWPENGIDVSFYGDEGSTGHEGHDLWDPDWAPCGSSGLGGSDPYNTARQEDYDGSDDHGE